MICIEMINNRYVEKGFDIGGCSASWPAQRAAAAAVSSREQTIKITKITSRIND
jgi:hypothetical protein